VTVCKNNLLEVRPNCPARSVFFVVVVFERGRVQIFGTLADLWWWDNMGGVGGVGEGVWRPRDFWELEAVFFLPKVMGCKDHGTKISK
jgi:hypothetical protein